MSRRSQEELVIEAGWKGRDYWREIWRYRELFYTLAWRDISVRYRQTIVGLAWAVLQPLLTMVVMTLVFGKLAKLSSEGAAPYALLVIAGMLPWQFFAGAFASASQSLVANAGLISKVYFPRMIIPAGAVVTSFVDLLIAFVILIGMMVWFQFLPDWRIVTLPFFMALAFLSATGLGLLVAALNVKYRDFRHVIPFVVQFGLYISPVGYSSSIVRHRLGDELFTVYCLNPMVGVIDGFRWALLGGQAPLDGRAVGMAWASAAVILMIGVMYFRRAENTFADVI
ncbi:MAG TPA: ABC transporter permease [Kofleriaceae bacterium]